MVPILIDHDATRIIGRLDYEGSDLVIEFMDGMNITKDMLFEAFGNIGGMAIEQFFEGDRRYIKKFKILEWSIDTLRRAHDAPPLEPPA
jgi:hypothetical protein